jgi:hypothetical protein
VDLAKQKFDDLSKEIQDCYDWDNVKESMRYQAALFALRVIKICYMLAYDVAFQCLFIPLWIWNGL